MRVFEIIFFPCFHKMWPFEGTTLQIWIPMFSCTAQGSRYRNRRIIIIYKWASLEFPYPFPARFRICYSLSSTDLIHLFRWFDTCSDPRLKDKAYVTRHERLSPPCGVFRFTVGMYEYKVRNTYRAYFRITCDFPKVCGDWSDSKKREKKNKTEMKKWKGKIQFFGVFFPFFHLGAYVFFFLLFFSPSERIFGVRYRNGFRRFPT